MAIPVVLAVVVSGTHPQRLDLIVTSGLCVFGFAFAVISSLHSYLILAYAGSAKAAEDVGFYYAANAAGRLLGILLSGALAQMGGLTACLWGSAAMLAVCLAVTFLLPSAVSARAVPA
jgi:predicted MFS family arabinose efflux permease